MKKITNNNKGFSLIELIIVIAIMAVLVAIIAPNLTKYLGSSKKNTDQKNADELASQLQTCITDYETTNGYLISTGGANITTTWTSSGSGFANATFAGIVDAAITSSTQSKETGAYASATITPKSSTDPSLGYTITVNLGNATATK